MVALLQFLIVCIFTHVEFFFKISLCVTLAMSICMHRTTSIDSHFLSVHLCKLSQYTAVTAVPSYNVCTSFDF